MIKLALAVLLALGATSSDAAIYRFQRAGLYFTSSNGGCKEIADQDAARLARIGYNGSTTGNSAAWWWTGDCSGFADTVGQTITYSLQGETPTTTASAASLTATLIAIEPDAPSDDVSGLALQRLLTYLAWSLSLCVGIVGGQQR